MANECIYLLNNSQGWIPNFEGAGPRETVGQKTRMNFSMWGTFSAKFGQFSKICAPAGALSP